jgi:hypothetical protein
MTHTWMFHQLLQSMIDPDAGPPIGVDPALRHRASRDTAAAELIPAIFFCRADEPRNK